ncbi:hypothetical protein [Corallococcus carmarthensis]|uniref:hypothetical protein n=1 Tax=Corallococcus carmarthensis TaxID=2316728 RepID=UPI00148E4024|nr:hypothetical protein [Corallococcus carmarthensis]NOK15918.1 hypothetical protein [Corallococcus carmarthensis]
MKPPALLRCAALLVLASCLTGADCGGAPPTDPDVVDPVGDVECSNHQSSSYVKASGRFVVTVDGRDVGTWRLAVSDVPHADGVHDLWFSACVLAGGGIETWRYSSIAFIPGPVSGTPVKLPAPQSQAPGFYGAVLDVLGNREHHFLIQGGGELEVLEYDPVARHFVARGDMFPEQGGTVSLSWDVTW